MRGRYAASASLRPQAAPSGRTGRHRATRGRPLPGNRRGWQRRGRLALARLAHTERLQQITAPQPQRTRPSPAVATRGLQPRTLLFRSRLRRHSTKKTAPPPPLSSRGLRAGLGNRVRASASRAPSGRAGRLRATRVRPPPGNRRGWQRRGRLALSRPAHTPHTQRMQHITTPQPQRTRPSPAVATRGLQPRTLLFFQPPPAPLTAKRPHAADATRRRRTQAAPRKRRAEQTPRRARPPPPPTLVRLFPALGARGGTSQFWGVIGGRPKSATQFFQKPTPQKNTHIFRRPPLHASPPATAGHAARPVQPASLRPRPAEYRRRCTSADRSSGLPAGRHGLRFAFRNRIRENPTAALCAASFDPGFRPNTAG